MSKYLRGSEWRRWDLHVHTPGTKKNDQYKGDSLDDKWDNFYTAVENYIGDGSDPVKNIAVIGVTDYLSIDNYLRVKTDHRLPDTIRMVLPNVEMRVHPISKKQPLNIHCIFSPAIDDQLNSRFFSKLQFRYQSRPYNATREDLIQLGRALNPNTSIDDNTACQEGIGQFVIDFELLAKVFIEDKELRENTIVVVANSGNDGASGITAHRDYIDQDGNSQLYATQCNIYQFSDLIFSGSPSDAKFFLPKETDCKNFKKGKIHCVKGCIHGSDAHSLEQLFEPDLQRYCWIKADPTFNGLKQLLYEPEMRIKISTSFPTEKPAYQIIESVKIGDAKVQDDPIVFNDDLTCIIGGKSTGKSLLLDNIALAIDEKQVKQKAEITNKKLEGRKLDEVVVHWKDGSESRLGESSDHKIVYIPQTYLNRLSDENEEKTEIDNIIEGIMLKNEYARLHYEQMEIEISNIKRGIDKKIYEITETYQKINQDRSKLKEIGTEDGIKTELKMLNARKEVLASTASISEDDMTRYNNAIKSSKEQNKILHELNQDIHNIEGINSVVVKADINSMLRHDVAEKLTSYIDDIVELADIKWSGIKINFIQKLRQMEEETQNEYNNNRQVISDLSKIIEKNESIGQISQAIQNEEDKLREFSSIKLKINESEMHLKSDIKELSTSFKKYKTTREKFAKYINDNQCINKDDLEFLVETPFRQELFTDVINELFDLRCLRSNKEVIDMDSFSENWFTDENIERFVFSCLSGKLRLVKNKTPENALREIFLDWYNTTYRVKMDHDIIEVMSPGKKALVLLKLLINLAESKCPILIDQPEDDLDNRSIFNELILYLKRKKSQRQIIIVTHNANVVLGGDAEEIIVANQDGASTPNKQFRFEYMSGAIEDDKEKEDHSDVLNSKGIQQHICDILEGGEIAFNLRKRKYNI